MRWLPTSVCPSSVVAFVPEPERKSPLGKIPHDDVGKTPGKIPHDVIMTSSYE